jgi:trehalose-6-phosphate synthase
VNGGRPASHQALTMPGRERRDRMRALRTVVRDNDVHRWTANFLEVLDGPA